MDDSDAAGGPGAIAERLNAAVGSVCWHVDARGKPGASFSLQLGAKVRRERPLMNWPESAEFKWFRGEHRFRVWCTWRLDGEGAPVTSSDQEERNTAPGLERLQGRTLVGARCRAPAWDLDLEFSGGLRLCVFCDHLPGDASIDTNWELWRGKEAVVTGPGYAWRLHKPEERQEG